MLDLRFILQNLDAVRKNCALRNVSVDLDRLVALDERRRAQIAEQQAVQERRNKLARDMKGRKPSEEERQLGKDLKEREASLEAELAGTLEELEALQRQIPNMTHPDVPAGADEAENRELRRANEILKSASAFFAAELDRR